MSKTRQELDALSELLAKEKQEDFEQHRQKVMSLPLEERIKRGYSWYPVVVSRSGYALGERAFVTIETEKLDNPHQFRAGKTVNFFTRQADAYQPEKTGVIQYVEKGKMKIILNAKDLPEWLGMGQLGVDLLFDERTYLEMEKALEKVKKAKNDRLADLRDVLLGAQPARFHEGEWKQHFPTLNESQSAAVYQAVNALDVSVIHGPPGTGKTTTLVATIQLISKEEQTVLVSAPSNTAVDLLTERLADAGLNVVRIGNISRIDESIINHTLEARLSHHPESKNIKKVKIQAANARRQAQRYRRKFGRDQYLERKQLQQEAKELAAWANQLEDRLIDQILSAANVITCTLVGSSLKVLEKRKFRTLVIDEAAQALEPACWIPISKVSRVVLAGDPHQLPPTVKSMAAQKGGLGITLIEKGLQRLNQTSFLDTQYRMNEQIMGFSNKRFYQNALKAGLDVAKQRLPFTTDEPVLFIDTAGCGFDEKMHAQYKSRFNPEEYLILREHLYQLIEHFNADNAPSIALISPYREQVIHIKQQVEEDPKLQEQPITINTIDGFQGQEKDVIYISLVRSNDKAEIGFLKDYRRMNVAMTRAKLQLVIVGDSATIGDDPFYQELLDYVEQEGQYQTAWEYMQG
ncbi:MAG: IGHMBP2 family helicase [Saprospiraceae bacterium]|nr:IGHMBP2 family helicase [Saprospiraceae bacterium]